MSEEILNETEKSTTTAKTSESQSSKVVLEKADFESLMDRIQALEERNKPEQKLKKVDEHYAYLREYDGFYLVDFGKFNTKKIDDIKTMFLNVKLEDLKGKQKEVEVKYVEFFAESEPRKKVQILKKITKAEVTTQDTISKVNLNEHEDKNFIPGSVDLDVISYDDKYEVEFLEGNLKGQKVIIKANVLNC